MIGPQKREVSYQTQTHGRFLVLWMVCRRSKMDLIVASFHVYSHHLVLVAVPFLLYMMILLINNADNELNFKYWMERQLNEFYTIHCLKWFYFIVLSVHNCNIKTFNMYVYKILKLFLHITVDTNSSIA